MTTQVKPTIKEAIVVEGRDDTINVLRAVDCMTIETHGFGIRKETWELIEKAYKDQGIIIFTDPDFSGEEIRHKILEKFPNSKQAFLTIDEATKSGDIGVENATPDSIVRALKNAHANTSNAEKIFTVEDLVAYDLVGSSDATMRRMKLGKELGIGYGNSKSFLKKLNNFGISRENFLNSIENIKDNL